MLVIHYLPLTIKEVPLLNPNNLNQFTIYITIAILLQSFEIKSCVSIYLLTSYFLFVYKLFFICLQLIFTLLTSYLLFVN